MVGLVKLEEELVESKVVRQIILNSKNKYNSLNNISLVDNYIFILSNDIQEIFSSCLHRHFYLIGRLFVNPNRHGISKLQLDMGVIITRTG